MITFEALQERSSRHYRAVHIENREGLKDPSCVICYPPGEISEEFDKFWNWYETKVPAATYSEYTLRIFKDLLGLEIGNDYRNNERDIVASYLRENAAEWYEEDQANIAQWHTDAQNDNFRERFKDYFSSQLKQIQWQVELTNIKQGIGENIEEYSRRFKKIMRKSETSKPIGRWSTNELFY